jgi:hypothetical protein
MNLANKIHTPSSERPRLNDRMHQRSRHHVMTGKFLQINHLLNHSPKMILNLFAFELNYYFIHNPSHNLIPFLSHEPYNQSATSVYLYFVLVSHMLINSKAKLRRLQPKLRGCIHAITLVPPVAHTLQSRTASAGTLCTYSLRFGK